MGFYLDENCEETMVDSFSEQSYHISHDVGVRVSMHRGGSIFGRRRGSRLNLTGELQVSYLVDLLCLRVLGMPLLIPPDEFPSTPRPSWQHPPLCSFNMKNPAPITPLSFDPSVVYTAPGKL